MGERKFHPDELTMFSIGEVAEQLSFSKKTIERFIREKRIKTVRVGARRRISKKALLDFLNTGSNGEFAR